MYIKYLLLFIQICNGLYKSACKFVLEISNAFVIFNSNPDLRAKEIWEVAYKYSKQEQVAIKWDSQFENWFDRIKLLKLQLIDIDEVEVEQKVDIEGYQQVFEGSYLTLPCYFMKVKDNSDLGYVKNWLQFETIPSIYGYLKLKNDFEGSVGMTKGVYIVTQRYLGRLFINQQAAKFIQSQKPMHVGSIIYEYFSCIYYLYIKDSYMPVDIAIFYDISQDKPCPIQHHNLLLSQIHDDSESSELFRSHTASTVPLPYNPL